MLYKLATLGATDPRAIDARESTVPRARPTRSDPTVTRATDTRDRLKQETIIPMTAGLHPI